MHRGHSLTIAYNKNLPEKKKEALLGPPPEPKSPDPPAPSQDASFEYARYLWKALFNEAMDSCFIRI